MTEASRQAWTAGAMALGWLLGLWALHQCQELPSALASAVCVSAALGLSVAAWRAPRWRALTAGLAMALLAFVQTAWRAEWRLQEELHPAWEGRDLVLTGRVDSLPIAVLGQGGVPGSRFEFALETVEDGAGAGQPAVPRQLMLLAYAAPGSEAPRITAGERWRWTARLKRPHGLVNPNGFDAELWLFEQGLRASGTVRPGTGVRLAAAPWWALDAARQRLRDQLRSRLGESGVAGILAALSLGDQAAISKSDWALLRDTGTAHLFSVSGLHITLLAWLAMRIADPLWRRSRRLCLWLAAPLAARWLGVAVAFAFALFSGWGVPAQRTVWMLATLAALKALGLRWPWPATLLAAAVVVTVVDPWALMQAGFWLSFVAVGLLMAAGDAPPRGLRERLWGGLKGQLVATVGLAPLSLVCFAQLSVVGLAANLVAIPVVSFVITPLALVGGLAPPLWSLAAGLTQSLLAYLNWLSSWPDAVWWVPAAPVWAQALGLLGAVLIVMPLPWRLRLVGLVMTVPLLWPQPQQMPAGEFELLAADVGQGNAVLVRTAQHALVFDTGPAYAPGADAGERVLLPLLRSLGVRQLDALVLSHRDSDHVGGAAALMKGLPVRRLLSSMEAEHPLRQRGSQSERCMAGQAWVWDGIRFELLHPLAAHYDQGLKPNDLSCVLRVTSASGRSVLLAGDLEADQERRLVARLADAPAGLRAEVLLVPHHGSKTSSSREFLAAVRPSLAVVQAGYRSRFGHPAPTVMARYQAAGIRVVATPSCGAWTWRSDEASVQGRCEREQRRRYWSDRVAPVVNEVPTLAGPELPEAPESLGEAP